MFIKNLLFLLTLCLVPAMAQEQQPTTPTGQIQARPSFQNIDYYTPHIVPATPPRSTSQEIVMTSDDEITSIGNEISEIVGDTDDEISSTYDSSSEYEEELPSPTTSEYEEAFGPDYAEDAFDVNQRRLEFNAAIDAQLARDEENRAFIEWARQALEARARERQERERQD